MADRMRGRMRASWPALLVLMGLLAGCTQGDPEAVPAVPGGTSPATVGDPALDPHGVPVEWNRGQWWRYEISSTDASLEGETTLVASAAGDEGYVVDTTRRDQALFDAEFDVSYIGAIGKDLSGQQGGRPVRYFQFPLLEGAAWTTDWDGAPVTVRALGPLGDAFELEAVRNGTLYVRYSYAPAAGFFGHIDFYEPDGSIGYGMRLVEQGLQFDGAYVRVRLEPHVEESYAGPGAVAHQSFDVGAGVHELLIRWRIDCADPGGAWALDVESTNIAVLASGGYREQGACPASKSVEHTVPQPFSGSWRYDGAWNVVGPGTASVQVRSLTYLETGL